MSDGSIFLFVCICVRCVLCLLYFVYLVRTNCQTCETMRTKNLCLNFRAEKKKPCVCVSIRFGKIYIYICFFLFRCCVLLVFCFCSLCSSSPIHFFSLLALSLARSLSLFHFPMVLFGWPLLPLPPSPPSDRGKKSLVIVIFYNIFISLIS